MFCLGLKNIAGGGGGGREKQSLKKKKKGNSDYNIKRGPGPTPREDTQI